MPRIPTHVRNLLRTVAAFDQGDGVTFHVVPRGRWQLDNHPSYAVLACTFYPLTSKSLLTASGDDPLAVVVAITDAGRAYLTGGAA
ncbi:hypothetical protein ACWHA1_05990 [Streptomyces decoyicus]